MLFYVSFQYIYRPPYFFPRTHTNRKSFDIETHINRDPWRTSNLGSKASKSDIMAFRCSNVAQLIVMLFEHSKPRLSLSALIKN